MNEPYVVKHGDWSALQGWLNQMYTKGYEVLAIEWFGGESEGDPPRVVLVMHHCTATANFQSMHAKDIAKAHAEAQATIQALMPQTPGVPAGGRGGARVVPPGDAPLQPGTVRVVPSVVDDGDDAKDAN
jgi:hypothetical protein